MAGVPITLSMNLIDMTADNAPMVGAAVYIWHCDGLGRYSMYSGGVTEETFLRGVQISDEKGQASFASIAPGCYPGRWPHIHFEVFPDRGSITDAGNSILTSQIAIPEGTCTAVYSGSAYEGSTENLNNIALERDGIFSDGWEQQLAVVSGDATSGYTMTIDVPIDMSTVPDSLRSGGPRGGNTSGRFPGGGDAPEVAVMAGRREKLGYLRDRRDSLRESGKGMVLPVILRVD